MRPPRRPGAGVAPFRSSCGAAIPDDELLDEAAEGRLTDPGVLHAQVAADAAGPALASTRRQLRRVSGLYLRKPRGHHARSHPVSELLDENPCGRRCVGRRSCSSKRVNSARTARRALEFLTSRTTFLNERLARHYGIPRGLRQPLPARDPDGYRNRAGVLGHASLLTATSYANRTSPVTRGKWILENIIGAPPPAGPTGRAGAEKSRPPTAGCWSMRERMEAAHARTPSCVRSATRRWTRWGLSLENFDAVGRWRERSESDGPNRRLRGPCRTAHRFDGPAGAANRPGEPRGGVHHDIDREAADLRHRPGHGARRRAGRAAESSATQPRDDYRFSSLIRGVVDSKPFRMRRVQP